jgi:hypothetical protein
MRLYEPFCLVLQSNQLPLSGNYAMIACRAERPSWLTIDSEQNGLLIRACRRITDIEIKGITRLPIIWVKAVLKEVRSK